MTFYPNRLSEKHKRMLREESANAPEVTAERGVLTVRRGRELPKGFSRRQRKRAPGILFTLHRPNGETSHSFRPDEPDPEDPGRKYELPSKHLGGPGNVLDVHPSCRHLIDRTDVPVIFVEGIKKADSLVSVARAAGVEVLVVAISGVWNWLSDGEPIPDMFDIPVEERRITICFDSDMLSNPKVQAAAHRLAGHLTSRGAKVFITYLPGQPDGGKMGADDFLAAGGTLKEFRALTRRYDPKDFARVRLGRNKRLKLAVKDLERRFWAEEWKGMGGHSDRDVARTLIEGAMQHGEAVEDGVRVVKSWGALGIEAKVSRRTLAKAIRRLEERGFCYRDNEGRRPDEAGAFVLRATVNHYEERGTEREETQELQGLTHPGLQLRTPCFMWSSPAYKPRRGLVEGTRKVREARPPEPRPAIKRLGKIRGAVVTALEVAGGSATIREIANILHRKRPRDIRRRLLPMLADAGIVVVDGDVVRLADDWLTRLEGARKLGRELEAEEVARCRLENKRKAFHGRHNVKPDPHWTNNPDAAGVIEDLRPASEDCEAGEGESVKPESEPKGNPDVAFVLEYIERLGKIRMGLLEEIWLEERRGRSLKDLRAAVDASGVRQERFLEFRNAVFLLPPGEKRGAA